MSKNWRKNHSSQGGGAPGSGGKATKQAVKGFR